MDILEKKTFYNNLFDFYGVLLTEKQQMYFQAYYFDDLSLQEIANIHEISRAAVHEQIQKTYNALEQYEEKLGLYDQDTNRNLIYDEYLENGNPEIMELIEKLKNLE
jgi:predicted DNA-binding protein YlxM (UPF0122 family)